MSASAHEFTLKTPPHFEDAVHLTKPEMEQQVLLMAALKMFELGKISSGKAAELAGMSRVDFLTACGKYKVSIFNYDADELEQELQSDLDGLEKLGL